jgi:hypothetical protein
MPVEDTSKASYTEVRSHQLSKVIARCPDDPADDCEQEFNGMVHAANAAKAKTTYATVSIAVAVGVVVGILLGVFAFRQPAGHFTGASTADIADKYDAKPWVGQAPIGDIQTRAEPRMMSATELLQSPKFTSTMADNIMKLHNEKSGDVYSSYSNSFL